jgi:hypothetical protein
VSLSQSSISNNFSTYVSASLSSSNSANAVLNFIAMFKTGRSYLKIIPPSSPCKRSSSSFLSIPVIAPTYLLNSISRSSSSGLYVISDPKGFAKSLLLVVNNNFDFLKDLAT